MPCGDFYPRSPRGERRWPCKRQTSPGRFLSTLPARGATVCVQAFCVPPFCISIHAPREGSDKPGALVPSGRRISIHAPREGSDGGFLSCAVNVYPFLSTLPARGATLAPPDTTTRREVISIHAPREGSDAVPSSSRLPDWLFLSTLPARGATEDVVRAVPLALFLSTLPARGATCGRRTGLRSSRHFYPRSPRGERQMGNRLSEAD